MGAPEAEGRNIALAVTPGLDDDAAGITAAQAHHHRIITAHSGENSISCSPSSRAQASPVVPHTPKP